MPPGAANPPTEPPEGHPMPGPLPLLPPDYFKVVSRLVHALLAAYCDKDEIAATAAQAEIVTDLSDPELGPARAESMFICITSYTASLLVLKLKGSGCAARTWDFTTVGRTHRIDEAAHAVAKAGVLALLRNPDSAFQAADLLAEQLGPIRDGRPVTSETVAASATVVFEAVWLAALVHSPRTSIITSHPQPA